MIPSTFWGVEVEAKKSQFIRPGAGNLIRICQIALGGEKENFESVREVVVSLIVDGNKSILARLSAQLPQLSVDLVMETNFRLLHNWKQGSVYFCGYTVNEEEEDEAPDGNGEPVDPSSPGSSAKDDDLSEDEMPETIPDDK